MGDLSTLIARLEAATGPDRTIDADIFRAIGLTETQERRCKNWCRMDGRTDLTRDHYIAAWAPAFTRSIDDALTLVPEGMNITIEIASFQDAAWITGERTSSCYGKKRGPAIAICIAALRAHAAAQGQAQ